MKKIDKKLRQMQLKTDLINQISRKREVDNELSVCLTPNELAMNKANVLRLNVD